MKKRRERYSARPGKSRGKSTADRLAAKAYHCIFYEEQLAGEDTAGESGLLYNAELYDDVTGRFCLRARWYNPKEARFFQPDIVRGDISDPQSRQNIINTEWGMLYE